MASFSSSVLDDLIAPHFADFRRAEIPDLRPEFDQAPHWVGNYLLNTVFRGRFRPGVHQVALGFLRRAHHGFRAYHDARDKTQEFVAGRTRGDQPLVLYFDAVAAWEVLVLQLQIANDLFRSLSGTKAFEPNDGSAEQRLYDSGNAVKHSSHEFIRANPALANTLPLWVLEDGIHANGGLVVSFEEVAGVLRDVGRLADALQDPTNFQKLAAG